MGERGGGWGSTEEDPGENVCRCLRKFWVGLQILGDLLSPRIESTVWGPTCLSSSGRPQFSFDSGSVSGIYRKTTFPGPEMPTLSAPFPALQSGLSNLQTFALTKGHLYRWPCLGILVSVDSVKSSLFRIANKCFGAEPI